LAEESEVDAKLVRSATCEALNVVRVFPERRLWIDVESNDFGVLDEVWTVLRPSVLVRKFVQESLRAFIRARPEIKWLEVYTPIGNRKPVNERFGFACVRIAWVTAILVIFAFALNVVSAAEHREVNGTKDPVHSLVVRNDCAASWPRLVSD
jgi:hypothetical protein